MPDSPPRVLAVLPNLIPSTVITVVKPLAQLHRSGLLRARITLEWLASPRDVRHADLVVFCRNVRPRYAGLLEAARRRGIPVIYDLDDNFFELPPDGEVPGHYLTPERRATLNRYLRGADLVRVYSEPLRARAATMNPHVVKISAPVDPEVISRSKPEVRRKRIAIVYATSRVRDQLYQIFMPGLNRVLKEYAGQVEAHFWGCRPPGLSSLPQIHYHPLVRSYDCFMRRFSRAGFEIGLAPLPKDVFHRSKTNNKFREYGACRIAGIYSNVDVYSSCVADGQTGLLVANEPKAWYRAMVQLIEDPRLRKGIQDRARAYVREHYSQEKYEQVFWSQITDLLETRLSAGPPRPRLAPDLPTAPESNGYGRGQRILAGALSAGAQLFCYVRRYGFRRACSALGWTCSDLWMLARLRYRLRRSPGDLPARRPSDHRRRGQRRRQVSTVDRT